MEPNLKLLLEDVLKQVCDDIEHSHDEILARFNSHSSVVDWHIFEFAMEEQKRNDYVSNLESAAVAFNTSFDEWKPQVEDLIHSVKLELTKLNTYFNREAEDSSNSKPGLTISSRWQITPTLDLALMALMGTTSTILTRIVGSGSFLLKPMIQSRVRCSRSTLPQISLLGLSRALLGMCCSRIAHTLVITLEVLRAGYLSSIFSNLMVITPNSGNLTVRTILICMQ
jgi:hypothetical protein